MSPSELTAQKELLQNQIETAKILQQKDTDAINKRIDDQLAQVGQGVDRFGVIASVLGTVVTTLLVLGGFIGYRNAKSEAKEAAKESAKESAKQWFDENAKNLKEHIADLEAKAQAAHQTIDASVERVLEHGQAARDRQEQAVQTLQAQIGDKTPPGDSKALQEALKVVAGRAEQLRNLAESSYSFEDWNTRAHAAYAAKQLEDAALYWLKASEIPNAGSVRAAQALFNRGVAQGQLGQSKEAIQTYDEVLRRFGPASEAALKELVARALVNKGVAQGQLGQSEEEIQTYDEVLRRFGPASEAALKELVASALVNKGVAQGQLGQSEEAIQTCDEVLRRFGPASEAALKEQVARALVNKGIAQGQLGQSEEEIQTYDEVLRRFGEESGAALKEQVARALNGIGFNCLTQAKSCWADQGKAYALLLSAVDKFNQAIDNMPQAWGMALGNRAYAQWLLGNADQAERDFHAGLHAENLGGQELYEGTLRDLDIHPIAEDQGMRQMVERQWQAWKAEQGKDDAAAGPTQSSHG